VDRKCSIQLLIPSPWSNHGLSKGIYDCGFMDNTIEILGKCKAHGFKVYLGPHRGAVGFSAEALLLS